MRSRQWLGILPVAALIACAAGRAPAATLRVMTFNIHAGHDDLNRVVAAIRAESPDIVALQEVDVRWNARSGFAHQADSLATKLGMHGRFAHIYSLPGAPAGTARREFGLMILSRHPIVEFRNRLLTRLSTVEEGAPPAQMPGFAEAVVDVGGTRVRVLNAHTDYRADPRIRMTQVAEMLAIIGETPMPTLLAGDFNAPPDAAEIQPLFGRFRDAWPGGSGMTYPADSPVKRIDYVLVSDHFRVVRARAPFTAASDHRPVIADLVIK